MSEQLQNDKKAKEKQSSQLSRWLDYRRKRFWALVAVLLYTLAGFFLVPVLVSHFAVKNVKDSMDREAVIGQVRFNPYVLRLQVNDFELNDTDGERLFSFGHLSVNFQLSSLFHWAWTFREFRLDGAHFFLERFTQEDSRLSRLLADMDRLSPEPAAESAPGGLPRLLIEQISINEGSLLFRDHVPETSVDFPAGPVTVNIAGLNTLPDRSGEQHVEVRLSQGALLTWQGSISLQPLESSGSLALENAVLDPLLPYLKSFMPLEAFSASLSARTDYQLGEDENGSVFLRLNDMESQLVEVAASGLSPSSEFFAFKALETLGGTLRYPETQLHLGTVRLQEPFLDAWLGEDGQAGLLQLVPEDSEPAADDNPEPGWQISADSFQLENGRVQLTDRSVQPAASLGLQDLALKLDGINNQDSTSMPFSLDLQITEGGSVGLAGQVVALPQLEANGEATIEGIPLSVAQTYVQQQLAIAIEDGAFGTKTGFKLFPDGQFELSGAMEITSLQLRDTVENEPLLAWEQMAIDRFEIDSKNTSAEFSIVRFDKPYGRIEINEDLSTNVGHLVKENGGAVDEAPGGPAWKAVVGGIVVDEGSMDFSDLSLPLPFGTNITSLDGTISTIDSESSEPSNIRMEGQVDEFGLARIEGSMNLLDPIAHTGVSVEFRNLQMSRLSPYTAQFAGREIDEGKMDLDLQYRIDGGLLDGENSIVLSDLLLGDEVESPDAVSLPLGLAVALLKDSNGVIDIDLPVSGDINDPEFKIGGVVWKAIAGLITKVVTAPFKLLGSLIGIDSEDFGEFQFLAGRYDLTPPELEKVAQLQQALAQRPELGLEINGVFDPAVDKAVLQYLQLRATAWERLGRDPTEESDGDEMLDEEIRKLLEVLYSERFPAASLDELKVANSAPPANDPEGKPILDELAYSAELQARLVASEAIGVEELSELASQRAQAISNAFLANGELDPARITVGESSETKSEDGEWVVMELGVAVD